MLNINSLKQIMDDFFKICVVIKMYKTVIVRGINTKHGIKNLK